MIAPLVRWEHSEDWYVTSYRMQEKIKSGERTVIINVNDEEQEYYTGHVIDGRNLFPATGYLVSPALWPGRSEAVRGWHRVLILALRAAGPGLGDGRSHAR